MSEQTELHKELTRQIQRFCQEHILPTAEEDDHHEVFRPEVFQKLGELGLGGPSTSEEFGGASLPVESVCHILQQLARGSVAYAVTLSVSSMVQSMIESFGTDQQKKELIPPLASGEGIGSFALSESQAGSDASSLRTKAIKKQGHYILTGNKMWISSATVAKTFVVMARTSDDPKKGISAFLISQGTEGLSLGKKEKKMGWRASPTCELVLENCKVPESSLLGKEGDGLKVALSALNKGRVTIGAIALGLAEEALAQSIRYTKERKQFNQAIFDFQGIQWMLADMATELEAARAMITRASQSIDQGESDPMLCSMAKLKATEMAMRVTTDAVQLHGGVGVTREYPVERFMRDAKILQIVEGTSQIQKVVISRNLERYT